MYKYGKMKLANDKVKEIKNKREFLYNKHQEIAEGYEKLIEKREGINKLIRFRRTLISYAEGSKFCSLLFHFTAIINLFLIL